MDPPPREPPLLRVPSDAHGFLRGAAPAVFAELAERLGDAQRLAAFAAFLGLSQTQHLEELTSEG